MRTLAVGLLLVVGVQIWLFYGGTLGTTLLDLGLVAGVVVLGAVPMFNRPIARALDRLRRPAPRTMALTAGLIALLAIAFFYLTAVAVDRSFHFRYHDEGSYLIQAQMLARGRLWMPPHPLAPSFETFHVFVDRAYASCYFPGTAIWFAPHVWLGVPPWIMSLLAAGLIVGLTYLVVTTVIDGLAGALAAMLMLVLPRLNEMALMTLSHLVLTLLGLALIAAWLQWRAARRCGWAMAIGALAGWASITRPVDAVAYAIPVAVAIALELVREPRPRPWLAPVLMIAGALPFLSVQLIFNRGVTGSFIQTPMGLYIERFHPGSSFGSRGPDGADADRAPDTTLPQKRIYHEGYIRPQVQRHHALGFWAELYERGLDYTLHATPSMLPLVLWPVAVLGLTSIGRGVVWSVLTLYVALYGFYPIFLSHYVIVVAPVLIFGIVLGKHVVEQTWPALRPALVSALTGAIVVLAVRALPIVDPLVRHELVDLPLMEFNAALPAHVEAPALVMFRFDGSRDNVHEEPVYNVDVAWPDDAPIIRAHDLGPQQDRKLFAYYAAIDPSRNVYVVDRADRSIRSLGSVGSLLADAESATRPGAGAPIDPRRRAR